MNKIKQIYQENIYGIIGTLVFHVLLVGGMLLSEPNIQRGIREEAILIDFTEQYTEIVLQKEKEEQQNKQSRTEQPSGLSRSNRAVNDAVVQDLFFDETYRREIDEAQKLVTNVNRQLSKKIPEIRRYEMPEESTEGMDPDSISNTIYSGESNIHYFLENRYHLRLPVPVYLAQGGGQVTVDIRVSPSGKVLHANPRPAPEITDPMLPEYARQAALRTVFNSDRSAPREQNGTITYTFVAQ
ncbi:MAG: hypothetical protein AB7D05_08825 [Mangrovibacterium sp.]